MKSKRLNIVFIFIGIFIGIILSLQIRAKPVGSWSSPAKVVETKKTLLDTFSFEQDRLKKELKLVEEKLKNTDGKIAANSSKKTIQTLEELRALTGNSPVKGSGIRITLNDAPSVSRFDFSSMNENFVQSADLRDLVNTLFLKDSIAVSINGKRVTPLTPIHSAFDSMLVGNFQISTPFVVEAVGNLNELKSIDSHLKNRKIQVFVDSPASLEIQPDGNLYSLKYLSEAK